LSANNLCKYAANINKPSAQTTSRAPGNTNIGFVPH